MSSISPKSSQADSPTADLETKLMAEAMYGLFLMSRDSELPPDAAAKFLEPPGLAKQVSVSAESTETQDVPGSLGNKVQSEDASSTTSCSGDGSSEHEATSDHDWQTYECAEGMAMDPYANPYANCWRGGWQRMTMPLSEDLLGLLSSRRGKQRLRALQSQSGAHAELDLTWRVLHLCGTQTAIMEACACLELMEGFTVKLHPALWAELLRCRNLEVDEAPLSLTRIQEALGRRVHVERETLALRVFAPRAERAATAQAVQALAALCTKQTIDLPADCDWNIIKELQASEEVTMKVEGSRVELVGLVASVEKAAEALRSRLSVGKKEPSEEVPNPMLLGSSGLKKSSMRPPPGLEHVKAAAKPCQSFGIEGFKDQICYVNHDSCTELCFY